MLTYELKKAPGVPLYEALYRCIRKDILSGRLSPGEKLPSKRALAENLKVSKITVEAAYSQLLAEGYISSREKVGFFVEAVQLPTQNIPVLQTASEVHSADYLDLTANGPVHFPFSIWSKLQREIMLDYGERLLRPLHHQGCAELRCAIAEHLAGFRGMAVDPDQIVIGAGTDFLYNLLIQLLGRDHVYALEDPGYDKIRKIYAAGGVQCVCADMDDQGVMPYSLGNARVLHISPSHHFPSGIVTPVKRRQELLSWAQNTDSWIIEDDYDSEFRFHTHPQPSMQMLQGGDRVIYMNTFSKSLAPSIRISYMVLPSGLMERFRQQLGFYSCTVSSFEQYTLARFLSRGYFEKHINRMRKFYQARRNRVVAALENCPSSQKLTIMEQDAGLHFLLRVDTELSDDDLERRFLAQGIRVRALSRYYHANVPKDSTKCLIVNYSGLDESKLERLKDLTI